jgi:hypothetical protein
LQLAGETGYISTIAVGDKHELKAGYPSKNPNGNSSFVPLNFSGHYRVASVENTS